MRALRFLPSQRRGALDICLARHKDQRTLRGHVNAPGAYSWKVFGSPPAVVWASHMTTKTARVLKKSRCEERYTSCPPKSKKTISMPPSASHGGRRTISTPSVMSVCASKAPLVRRRTRYVCRVLGPADDDLENGDADRAGPAALAEEGENWLLRAR